MKNSEMIAAIKEMMEAYNLNRSRWIEKKGNDEGFDEWFTAQVMRGSK